MSTPEPGARGRVGAVAAEDRQVTPAVALVLSPLDIHVAGYNTAPGTRLDVTANASYNNGGSLKATAQLAANGSGDTTAHVELAQLDLYASCDHAIANMITPANRNRAPAMRNGGMLSMAKRIPR